MHRWGQASGRLHNAFGVPLLHPAWVVAGGLTLVSSAVTIRTACDIVAASRKHVISNSAGVLLKWLAVLNILSVLAWSATWWLSSLPEYA
jgi:hypothetical protein